MIFYIKMPDDSEKDAIPVGELSYGTLWTDKGFWLIEKQIARKNEDFASNAIIINERGYTYSIKEFLDMLIKEKVVLK